MIPNSPNPEWRQLLDDYLNGIISEPDLDRLQTLLKANPRARRFYRQYLAVDASMRDLASAKELQPQAEGAGDHLQALIDQPLPIDVSSRGPRLWALAALVLALLVPSAFFLKHANPQPERSSSVAVLTQAVEATWKAGQPRWEAGAALPAGHLSLASGLVQIEFFSGAIVILEGPAEFDLVSSTRGFCSEGKLRSSVPLPAHGFTIGAPGMDVVDLGTEFALAVNPRGESQVHVLEGEVELHRGQAKASSLYAGQSARFSATVQGASDPSPTNADSTAFVGRAELASLASGRSDLLRARWLEESSRIRSLPETVAYYGFEPQEPWSRTLHNEGATPSPSLEGAIIGCEWTRGRWLGKGALEFKRPSDRVRVNVPGEFSSLSFSAWVRIEGWDRWLSSLLLADEFKLGAVHWQLSDKGEIVLGINTGTVENHFSAPVIGPGDLGRWVYLATVYDSSAKLVIHYLDGQPVSSTPIKTSVPLHLGPAEIGNWNPGRMKGPSELRSFNGRIDEFAIFNRALSASEILNAYEKGKPHG